MEFSSISFLLLTFALGLVTNGINANKFSNGTQDMVEEMAEDLKKCPFLRPASLYSILPCQCKADYNDFNVYLLCDRFNNDTSAKLAKNFECRNKIHKVEINMHGEELNITTIGTAEDIGKLQIENFHILNVSKITSDLEPNVFNGSSQTLKEIKIQRLPGMERGGGTIKTEAFSGLVALTTIHLGEDFQTIQSKAFSGLPSVVNIKMEGVKTIETNAFYDMEALQKLDLANNEITDLGSNFVNETPNLEIINLSYNNISSLPYKTFENLTALTNIYLNNNKIISINNYAMTNLPKLQFLNISNNEIETVGTFLDQIKNKNLVINLSENKIKILMEESFKPFLDNIVDQNGIGHIDLNNVQLYCGCDEQWLFNQPKDSALSKFKNAKCEDGLALEEVDARMFDGLCPSECILTIEPGIGPDSPECYSYKSLTDSWRRIDYYNRGRKAYHCDSDYSFVKNWYRFEGDAGSKLATTNAPTGLPTSRSMICGTYRTSWMTAEHPEPDEGIVSRKVCFEFNYGGISSSLCDWPINIQVRACYGKDQSIYYVYELIPVTTCEMAYCALP